MLHVRVEDVDPNQNVNDVVDVLTVAIDGSVHIDQVIGPAVFSGMFRLAQMELTLSVHCSDGFYGPFCNVTCPNGASCNSCLPGFTGRYCQTEINAME